MNSTRVKYWIDKTGFFAESAMILLVLAAIFRVIGCWGAWNDRVNFLMLLALPVCCCLLLALCMLLFGKKGFFLSFIPVLLGVVFFVFKSLSFTSWLHTVLCILLYMLVAVIYTATVFGWIGTKWLLPPLFALPFVYHIVIEDLPALNNTAQPVTFMAGMQEMSVLCIMAALFCIGMGLKKRPVEPKSVEAEVVEPPAEPVTPPESAPVEAVPAESEPVPAEPEPAPAVPEHAPAAEAVMDMPAAPVDTGEKPAEESAIPEEENPYFSGEPYEPVLTLDPEPWEPEELNGPESEHEQK